MMTNITDYVTEYGEKTLDELPFNEVDSLVLSQFAYLKFDKLLLTGEKQNDYMTIKELDLHPKKEEMFTDARFADVNKGLFNAMADSRRFANIKLFNYVNIVDAQWEIQFSAITCIFENGFIYIAYRGTDESITGWKEDFNMSFMTPVPAQEKAVQYLNITAKDIRNPIILGGHSKGGNLAVYAAMKCMEDIRDRITGIYSHDGPGFVEGILDSEDFARIKDKIRKSVPRSSIVGMVLQTQENYEVIRCRHFGILQHDPFNWITDGAAFKKADSIHKHSYLGDASVNRWISDMDYEKRQDFVELLFDIINGSGATDLNEFKADPIKMGKNIKDAYENLDEDDKNNLRKILKNLSEAVNATIKDYISEQVEDEKKKYEGKIKKIIKPFTPS